MTNSGTAQPSRFAFGAPEARGISSPYYHRGASSRNALATQRTTYGRWRTECGSGESAPPTCGSTEDAFLIVPGHGAAYLLFASIRTECSSIFEG